MNRRTFLKTLGVSAAALSLPGCYASTQKSSHDALHVKRPNVLFIMTDQQFAGIMSCRMGTKYINTPAMDSLAKDSMLFTEAYTANPLCMPARNSIFTGRYPHETGCQKNSDGKLESSEFRSMGRYFKNAGYDTGYVGKWHLWYKSKDKQSHGFDMTAVLYGNGHDDEIPAPAIEFMQKDRQKPFLLVVSFSNPHDVCQLARHQKLPSGPIPPLPPMEQRPPLKSNMAPPTNESDALTLMRKSYHNSDKFPVGDYDEDKWRRLSWGYYRLVEKVDALIAKVLDGLKHSGQQENTLIVFTSDHGDCHGAHRFNQKTVFYEESARVPLILSYKNVIKHQTSDILVNTGIDILATMLDFANIDQPKKLPGRSLKTIALGKQPKQWRDYIVVQNFMTQGGPVDGKTPKVKGRMVRSKSYKYCLYDQGKQREELFDMKNDRLETENLAAKPDCKDILKQHRTFLTAFAVKHKDETALVMLKQIIKDQKQ
jgi:arylsulfatase A-like enzyme